MRYYKQNGKHFIENGSSLIRVEPLLKKKDPYNNGRICNIFAVQEVLHVSEMNPIERGSQVAMSFPQAQVNAESYEWSRGEPTMVPFKIHFKDQPIVEEPDPAML